MKKNTSHPGAAHLTRRHFLQGGSLTLAGLTLGSLVGCSSDEGAASVSQKTGSNIPENWDEEADVVIVGLGAAALSAAISAKQQGVERVIALEVAPEEFAGGSTRVSGNMLMIPDNVEDAIVYQTNLNSSYVVPEEYMKAWAEGVVANMDWLTDLGYDLQPGTAASPEFPGVPGCEAIKTYYVDGICGMASLWEPLMETADEMGVEVFYDTRAVDLAFDYQTKEVFGVVCEDGKSFKANKGVILACGGFSANPDMMRNYYVELGCPDTFVNGSPYNRGDGVKMGQKIGADLWHMNSYAGAMPCVRTENPDSNIGNVPYPMSHDFIFVNNEGHRFMYEETKDDLRHGKNKYKGVWPLMTIPSKSYMIMGKTAGESDILGAISYMTWSAIHETGCETNQDLIDAGIMYKADTIEEIAEKIGFPPEALADTVATFNQYCADGKDPEFGRGEAVIGEYFFDATSDGTSSQYADGEEENVIIKPFDLAPLEPPFYVIEIALGILNTQGGPLRNGNCEVLDVSGNVIPRLYSAGELGSIYSYMYNGGGNISEAVATGRVAGQQVSTLEALQ